MLLILVGHRPSETLATLGRSSWWREPLNFMASTKENVDELGEHLQSGDRMISSAQQIDEMAAYAPYTSPGALEIIRDSVQFVAEEEMPDVENIARSEEKHSSDE